MTWGMLYAMLRSAKTWKSCLTVSMRLITPLEWIANKDTDNDIRKKKTENTIPTIPSAQNTLQVIRNYSKTSTPIRTQTWRMCLEQQMFGLWKRRQGHELGRNKMANRHPKARQPRTYHKRSKSKETRKTRNEGENDSERQYAQTGQRVHEGQRGKVKVRTHSTIKTHNARDITAQKLPMPKWWHHHWT